VIGLVVAETKAAQGQPKLGLDRAFVTSMMLDDSRIPTYKGIFIWMLGDYETRSETLRLGDVLTKTNAAQLTTATHRRKQ